MVEEVKSPMFSTGIGLVIKGLKGESDKVAKTNISEKDQDTNSASSRVKEQDASKDKAKFFDSIKSKFEEWLSSDADFKD